MNKLWWAIMFLAAIEFVFIVWVLFNRDKSVQPEPIQTIMEPTKFDITLECQKMSSQATNNNWNYTNCLKELEKSVDSLKIRLD